MSENFPRTHEAPGQRSPANADLGRKLQTETQQIKDALTQIHVPPAEQPVVDRILAAANRLEELGAKLSQPTPDTERHAEAQPQAQPQSGRRK